MIKNKVSLIIGTLIPFSLALIFLLNFHLENKEVIQNRINENNILSGIAENISKENIALDAKQEEEKKLLEKLYFYINERADAKNESREYAQAIISASKKYNIGIEKLYAGFYTESTFNTKVKHPLNKKLKREEIIGPAGIYAKHWEKELISKNIIKNRNDLKKIGPSAEAMAYIFKQYYNKYNSWPKALANYKGSVTSPLAKRQARNLLSIGEEIKKKIN